MASSVVVEAARRVLGPVGAFLPVSTGRAAPVDLQRHAVRRLERAGYRAAWTNEAVGGKDALVQLAVLMAATERMVFGTGIANIWARAPQTAHGAAALLAQAYPGRFVLGLGVGYPQQAASAGREFGRPLATMRDYLGRMSAPTQLPAPEVAYPRIIGANGPKMLALAAELTDGAMPAMKPPEFTAQARQLLGPDKLLVVFMHASEDGDVPATTAQVREHLTAGADHVLLGVPIGTDFTAGVEYLELLAPAVAEIT
jgi:probable F420-dependent oxidoreductase